MFTNTKRESTQRNRQRLCGRIRQMSRKTSPQSLALQSSVEREEKEMYSPRSKYFPVQIPQSSMARTETLESNQPARISANWQAQYSKILKQGSCTKRKKNCYYSYMSVRNLPQFAEHIGFTIERKQRRLRAART